MSTSLSLPGLGEPVDVVLGGTGYRTRVCREISSAATEVCAPMGVPPADLPVIGSRLDLRWYSPRGRFQATALVTGISKTGELTWALELDGEICRVQARRYVRSGGGEAAMVRRFNGKPAAQGTVIDLSECSMRARLACQDLKVGERVFTELLLDGRIFEVLGEVYRVRPVLGQSESVVLFEVDDAQADFLRRYVFTVQRRLREAELSAG